MMWTRIVFVVVVLSSVAGACIPIRVSEQCQKEMDACLKNCPVVESTPDEIPDVEDSRSLCERQCHDRCT
jgi:hypothetical protein